MSKLIDAWYRLLNVLIVLAVVILIIPVMAQILSRFTGLIPRYIWTEEMARFFFIWMVMLGAMVAARDGTHFDVDVWPDLKPRANALLRLVSSLFMLLTAVVFLWWACNSRPSAGTRPPKSPTCRCGSSSSRGLCWA
ncbi:TRAP transporter small permease subunit [Variovorax sp. J22R133]|uniref:TRAP transporter small permease n=1 Tax=Variovorax brevis TaxID=3053503 RepID=UPI00257910B2|nr:TRAP transporter small permease subunit [Variovorax sp. J22R133]MDM0117303.1 TRAP transporter small permease subunit [Variovorax sp. J22R133]